MYHRISDISRPDPCSLIQERDEAGNWSERASKGLIINTVSPTGNETVPLNDAEEQSLNKQLTITFSKNMAHIPLNDDVEYVTLVSNIGVQ